MTPPIPQAVTVIEAGNASLSTRLHAAWNARELLAYLVKRDLNGRYRPASLGRAWIFLRPTLEILTYVLVFGVILGVHSGPMPYPLFLCSGLVPWLFFHQTVGGSSTALASARHIMSKVHFPRLVVPLSNLALALLDLLVLFAVVLGVAAVYRTPIGVPFLALPVFLLMMAALAFGVSLLVASWSVSRPDVTIGVPVVLRVLMYLSPIVYPPTRVPDAWRNLYDLNPIAQIVTGIRWSLGSTDAPSTAHLAIAVLAVSAILLAGLLAFARTERRMIDFL